MASGIENDEFYAAIPAIRPLQEAYIKRQTETREFRQPKRERKAFATKTPEQRVRSRLARSEARRITPEQAHARAVRRALRKLERSNARPVVMQQKKEMLQYTAETVYTSGQPEKPNRSKPFAVTRAKVEERKRKAAEYEERNARRNFKVWIEEAFANVESEEARKLPKPERAKPAWFPLEATVAHSRTGQRLVQVFLTLDEYRKFYKARRGQPLQDRELAQIEKAEKAARDRRDADQAEADDEDHEDIHIELEDWEAYKESGVRNFKQGKRRSKRSQFGHSAKNVSKAVKRGEGRERGKFRNEKGFGKKQRQDNGFRSNPPLRPFKAWAHLAIAIADGKEVLTLYDLAEAHIDNVRLGQFAEMYGDMSRRDAISWSRDCYEDDGVPVTTQIIVDRPVDKKRVHGEVASVVNEIVDRYAQRQAAEAPAPRPAQTVAAVAPTAPQNDAAAADVAAMGLVPIPDAVPTAPPAPEGAPPAQDGDTDWGDGGVAESKDSEPPVSQSAAPATAESPATVAGGKSESPALVDVACGLSTAASDPDSSSTGGWESFRAAGRPGARSLHRADMTANGFAMRKAYLFDPMGTPYCGYVAVDLAFREARDEGYYAALADEMGADDGTAHAVWKYAHSLGLNLVVWKDKQYAGIRPKSGALCWEISARPRYDPSHPTVHLHLRDGHYQLICTNEASNENLTTPEVYTSPRLSVLMHRTLAAICVWIAAFTLLVVFGGPKMSSLILTAWLPLLCGFDRVPTLKFEEPFYAENNIDRRVGRKRRDKLASQDAMSMVCLGWDLFFFNHFLWKVSGDVFYCVSLSLFYPVYEEAQILVAQGRDPFTLTDSVLSNTDTNIVSARPAIWSSSAYIGCLAGKYITGELTEHQAAIVKTAYNANASYIVADEASILTIEGRQADVGFGNKVVRTRSRLSAKVGKAVAHCALPVLSEKGQIGPGFYPLGDGCSLLSAFALRSMCGPEPGGCRRDFVEWSKAFMRRFVEEIEPLGVEPNERDAYRECQKGKKPASYVEKVIKWYDQWVVGRAPRDFERDSCFVKFENSAKEKSDGSWGVKPRLIMTMSMLKAVQCAPVLRLIHAFNRTSFNRFQIKELTPAEMRQRIETATDRKHNVSDYSSFEASIDETVREIENYVMELGLSRAGWLRTARYVRQHTRPHLMKTPESTFRISTRCSGDYWTSFGNGIVNVCIMAYCAHLKGLDPYKMPMIAEGDDGIVASEIPDLDVVTGLGFKYSSALSGNAPGDTDFLRSRWMDGKRYLDVGRCFSATWLKRGCGLSEPKRKFLVRCVANSLYHLSPGHPVLGALVARLRRESEGWKHFRGYKLYLESWSAAGLKDYSEPDDYEYAIDETMRGPLAAGAAGFPPIPIASQLELERTLLDDEVPYVGRRLSAYGDFRSYVESRVLLHARAVKDDDAIRALTGLFGSAPEYVHKLKR